jgi:hypothetical protein
MKTPLIVSCNSKEEFIQVLDWAKQSGYTWKGDVQIVLDARRYEQAGHCILFVDDKYLQHSSKLFFQEHPAYGPMVSFDEFNLEAGVYRLPKYEDLF